MAMGKPEGLMNLSMVILAGPVVAPDLVMVFLAASGFWQQGIGPLCGGSCPGDKDGAVPLVCLADPDMGVTRILLTLEQLQ
jgi:hypothetical protein